MNTAEITARNFYNTYHLETMPEDVKMNLIVLLAKASVSGKSKGYNQMIGDDDICNNASEEVPPMLSSDDIKARMTSIEDDIKSGNTRPIDEFFEEAEANYPWLCK